MLELTVLSRAMSNILRKILITEIFFLVLMVEKI